MDDDAARKLRVERAPVGADEGIKAQGAVFGPGGHGKSAPINPHDISSVAAKALATRGHEGETYVLTGEELLSAAEQVDIIGAAIGKPLRFVDVPEAGARAGMLKSGIDQVMVDALMELHEAAFALAARRFARARFAT